MLFRPKGKGPFPAVVALHGCGGLFNDDKAIKGREEDWAERLVAAGYVVLLPDSFTARGVRQICSGPDRKISPAERAEDAAAAAGWLAKQPFVDASRMGLMGWSHGAMTVLWTVRKGFMQGPQYKVAIGPTRAAGRSRSLPTGIPACRPLCFLGRRRLDRAGPCRKSVGREGFRPSPIRTPTTLRYARCSREMRGYRLLKKARRTSAPTRKAKRRLPR